MQNVRLGFGSSSPRVVAGSAVTHAAYHLQSLAQVALFNANQKSLKNRYDYPVIKI
jgi:hypothetical protein